MPGINTQLSFSGSAYAGQGADGRINVATGTLTVTVTYSQSVSDFSIDKVLGLSIGTGVLNISNFTAVSGTEYTFDIDIQPDINTMVGDIAGEFLLLPSGSTNPYDTGYLSGLSSDVVVKQLVLHEGLKLNITATLSGSDMLFEVTADLYTASGVTQGVPAYFDSQCLYAWGRTITNPQTVNSVFSFTLTDLVMAPNSNGVMSFGTNLALYSSNGSQYHSGYKNFHFKQSGGPAEVKTKILYEGQNIQRNSYSAGWLKSGQFVGSQSVTIEVEFPSALASPLTVNDISIGQNNAAGDAYISGVTGAGAVYQITVSQVTPHKWVEIVIDHASSGFMGLGTTNYDNTKSAVFLKRWEGFVCDDFNSADLQNIGTEINPAVWYLSYGDTIPLYFNFSFFGYSVNNLVNFSLQSLTLTNCTASNLIENNFYLTVGGIGQARVEIPNGLFNIGGLTNYGGGSFGYQENGNATYLEITVYQSPQQEDPQQEENYGWIGAAWGNVTVADAPVLIIRGEWPYHPMYANAGDYVYFSMFKNAVETFTGVNQVSWRRIVFIFKDEQTNRKVAVSFRANAAATASGADSYITNRFRAQYVGIYQLHRVIIVQIDGSRVRKVRSEITSPSQYDIAVDI